MAYSDIYLYSPLSVKTVAEGHNRALLLQFILSELLHAMDAKNQEYVFTSPACFFPYDWSYEVGCLNKMSEHARLLPSAFPELPKEILAFQTALEQAIETRENFNLLFTLLEPFLIACKQSESLLLFLLRHHEEIDVTALLKKMAPKGLEELSHLMQREFKNRGFHALIPEIEQLMSLHE